MMKRAMAGDAEQSPSPDIEGTQASSPVHPIAVEEDDADLSPKSPHVASVHWPMLYGSLHLQPCTFEEYLNITGDYGRYDLVDGILHLLPMTDGHYDGTIVTVQTFFNERKRAGKLEGTVFANCAAIAGAKVGISADHYRTPGISIGENKLTATDVSFPVKHPPLVVVDVTLFDRENDFNKKMEIYAGAKIPEYVIIDRDIHRDEERTSSPCVMRGTLQPNGKYAWKTYSGSETFRTLWLGRVAASALYTPESPSKIVEANVARERRVLKKEEARRKAAEIRANAAEIETNAAEIEAKAAEIEANAAEIEAKAAEIEAKAAEIKANAAEIKAESAEIMAKSAETNAEAEKKKEKKVSR